MAHSSLPGLGGIEDLDDLPAHLTWSSSESGGIPRAHGVRDEVCSMSSAVLKSTTTRLIARVEPLPEVKRGDARSSQMTEQATPSSEVEHHVGDQRGGDGDEHGAR